MPPVFGPSSPSRESLEVLRGRERRGASRRRQARRARPPRPRAAPRRRPRPRAPARSQGRVGLLLRAADEDALARGEPVGLDDAGGARLAELRRGRYACGLHDLLGEGLRALDSRCGPARAEDRDARSAEPVGDPADERGLRPDDDEVDLVLAAEAEQSLDVVQRGSDGSVPSAAIPGFPGAACSSPSASLWAIFQASACSRPPDPTTRTFTRASLSGGRWFEAGVLR